MWDNLINRRFLTNLFISAIFLNIKLINTQITNSDNSLETNLPDLMPNEDTTINSQSHIALTSIEDEIPNTSNTPINPIILQSQDIQDQIVNDQSSSTVDITEGTSNTIDYNEQSNEPVIPEISNPFLIPIAESRIIPPEMDEYSVKVQKCCPKGQILVLGQPGQQSRCNESTEGFDLPVFYANLTHYWNFTTTSADNVEIVSNDPCTQNKFYLDPEDENDTFRILHNSSLYIPFNMDMLNTNQYCLDTVQGEKIFATALICTPAKLTVLYILYIIGIFISIVCLIGLTIYSIYRKDIKEDHKKCLAFFAGTMATAYFFVAINSVFHNYFNNTVTTLMGYVIYYLNLNYYLWLNVLSYDTYRCARYDTIDIISYMKWYLITTFSVPLFFILITCFDGFKPALPNLYLEHSSRMIFIIFLYVVPIIISTLGNVILILNCCISLPKDRYNNVKELIATFQSKDWKPPPKNIKEIKKMYRRILIFFIVIFAFFLVFSVLDLLIYLSPGNGEQQPHFIVKDVLFSLQGMFISLIFINYSRRKLRTHTNTELDQELQLMRNGTAP